LGDTANAETNGGGAGKLAINQFWPPPTERKTPPGTPANTLRSALKLGDTATAVVVRGDVSSKEA
jgi:hypothetical protein